MRASPLLTTKTPAFLVGFVEISFEGGLFASLKLSICFMAPLKGIDELLKSLLPGKKPFQFQKETLRVLLRNNRTTG